ncbi:MAG: phosphatase PAP2 family protein [Candidatus Sulfotelmatobacter sp.]
MRPRYWHYSIGLLLGGALIPVLEKLRLPVRFDWATLATAYWLVLAAQSIFVATLLCLIGRSRHAMGPVLERYRREPLRIGLLLLSFVVLGWAFTWVKAAVLTVDIAAILEFRERRRTHELRPALLAILLHALYLFAGFLLVLAYNDVIVSVRFNFAYDPAFNAMDRWLLRGGSVSDLSHWAVRTFPLSFFQFLEFIYFGMFPQIGAAIILLGLYDGRNRALQFVGAILLAYYIALGLFFLWPSQGPYYLCPDHFSRFPRALQAYSIQKFLIAHALTLWNRLPIRRISTDYFIAFPCMHIAQPLVVMWFLRRWKRIVIVLCAYDAILIIAILLLEWHYVVDIIAGVMVAGISLTITDFSAVRRTWARHDSDVPMRQGAPAS